MLSDFKNDLLALDFDRTWFCLISSPFDVTTVGVLFVNLPKSLLLNFLRFAHSVAKKIVKIAKIRITTPPPIEPYSINSSSVTYLGIEEAIGVVCVSIVVIVEVVVEVKVVA